MQWFKFYGQDFLTDPKMRALTVYERACWVVLMCLSNAEDKGGVVSYVNEEAIMHQAGVEFNTPMWMSTLGFLKRFQRLKMVELSSNGTVTIKNWNKRQERALTNAERQARHRQRNAGVTEVTKSNTNSNARVEESRNNTAAKPQTTMKKNRMGSYREDAPQDSYDESIDLDTGEAVKPKERAGVLPAYKELVDWSQTRRGFKFLSIPKQYKAFKEAKTFGLMPADLKKRWLELEEDKFYAEKGFDWPTVVYSFNRKKK